MGEWTNTVKDVQNMENTFKLRLKLHNFEKDWRKLLVYKQTVVLN